MKKYLVMAVMLLAACGKSNDVSNKAESADENPAVVEAKQDEALISLTMADNNQNVNAKVNQEVELTLDANATTGYNWAFITYVDGDDVVEELVEKYVPDEADGKLGVGGKAIYRIKLLKAGEVYITANYVRAGTDEEAQNSFNAKVIVE